MDCHQILVPNVLGWQGSFGNSVPLSQTKSHFLETLNFSYLTKLTNNPINHQVGWLVIPAKLPSNIPKFDGNPKEDPSVHVMTFHLWFSLNSLNNDSLQFRLFQCTLTGTIAKWYVELPCAPFNDFTTLSIVFLMHFQLHIFYNTGIKLLTTLR